MTRLLQIGLVGFAFLAARPAASAEVTTEGTFSPRESPRALNGHVFQPSRLVLGPFSTTSFGTSTLFGVGKADAPTYNLLGNVTGTRKYSLAAYGQSLELDLGLTPDIAVRAQASGLIFSGTSGVSLLVAGATAQTGFLLGLVAGRDLGTRTRLAFVIDATLAPDLSVTVASAVLRAIQDRSFSDAGLFTKVNRLRVGPGASFAWAPSAAIGFVAEARYVFTRRVSKDDSQTTNHGALLGATAELDLDPLVHWPIGFQGVYSWQFGDIAHVSQAGGSIFYTRRVRLALGLEVVWRRGRIRPGVEPPLESNSSIGALLFRYYW